MTPLLWICSYNSYLDSIFTVLFTLLDKYINYFVGKKRGQVREGERKMYKSFYIPLVVAVNKTHTVNGGNE